MVQGISDNVNIFNPERDILDRVVEGYEENVPLVGQIAVGFTPPGMAMDVAEAGKYGRQGVRDFRSGLQNMGSVLGMRKAPSQLASGAGNLGIAALSALGVIPLVGDLLKSGGKSAIKRIFLKDDILAKADKKDLEKIINDTNLSDALKTKQITNHPAIIRAEKLMTEMPPTSNAPDFGTEIFTKNRQFNFPDKKIIGYENAIDELYTGGKILPYREMNIDVPKNLMKTNSGEKIATIAIGPPAAGKSAIANPLAIKYNATIIDPDEAKKILPEFGGGLGSNAVHQESKILANGVQYKAMARGDNLVLPKVGADPNKLRKEIMELKDNGYKVNLVLTELDPDLAFVRMNSRYLRKGKLIGSDAAEAYRGKSEITYKQLKKEGIADGYGRIDTTTGIKEPKQVFEDTTGIFQNSKIRLREGRRAGGSVIYDSRNASFIQPSGAETITVMVD